MNHRSLPVFIKAVLFFALIAAAVFLSFSDKSVPDLGTSVSMTGYGAERPSLRQVFYSPEQIEDVAEAPFAAGADANKYMPLFINRDDIKESVPATFPAKILVFGTKKNDLVFYDLNRKEIFKSFAVSKIAHIRSGVFSKKFAKVFYYSDFNIVTVDLKSMTLTDTPVSSAEYLDLSQIPKSVVKETINHPCNTSLGISSDDSFLFWGCSTPSEYGEIKGNVGLVIKWPLDAAGQLESKNKVQYFRTSKIINSREFSGLNSGVWNSGMGPTQFENNLLIATGNGPNNPELDNFGCSVVVLDKDNLRVKAFDALEDSRFQECLALNLDTSSGSIAITKIKGRTIGAIASGDELLRIFDIKKLIQRAPRASVHIPLNNQFSFGTTVILPRAEDSAQILFLSHTSKASPQSSFFATEKSAEKVLRVLEANNSLGVTTRVCEGYLAPESGKGSLKMSLYYSGYARRTAFWVNPSTAEKTGLTSVKISKYESMTQSKVYWAPYVKTNVEEIFPVLRSAPLSLEKKMLTSRFVGEQIPVYVSKSAENTPCGDEKLFQTFVAKGFRPFYKYSFEQKSQKKSWQLESHAVNSNLEHSVNWILDGRQDEKPPNSSFMAAYDKKPTDGFLLIPISISAGRTRVKIIRTATGKILKEFEFEGQVHFSQPLVLGRQIFISTQNHGIRHFEVTLR